MYNLLMSLPILMALAFPCLSMDLLRYFKGSSIKSHTSSLVQITVDQNLTCSTEEKVKGIGFIFDANEGVVCTSTSLIGTLPFGSMEVIANDQTSYDVSSVEILGSSPIIYGNYTFLRIKELLHSNQVTIDPDHLYKKTEEVSFYTPYGSEYAAVSGTPYIRDDGLLKIKLNNRDGSDNIMKKEIEGTPVFSKKGSIIGLLSYDGNQDDLLINPIWYASKAYNAYIKKGALPKGFALAPEYEIEDIEKLSKYFDIPLIELKKFIPRDNSGKERLRYVKRLSQASVFEFGDIIMKVDGCLVGKSHFALDKLIHAKESVSVQIYRGNQPISLQVPVKEFTSAYHSTIEIEGSTFAEFPMVESWRLKISNQAPICFIPCAPFIITHIDATPVQTFNNLIKELHAIIIEKEEDFFQLRGFSVNDRISIVDFKDLTQWRGKKSYIFYFSHNLHRWRQVDISEYVQLLLNGEV